MRVPDSNRVDFPVFKAPMYLGSQWQPRKRQANESTAASSEGTHQASVPSDSDDVSIRPLGQRRRQHLLAWPFVSSKWYPLAGERSGLQHISEHRHIV